MPLFEITAPDGQVYEVNAPEGATEQEAIAYVQSNIKSIPTQKKQTYDPTEGMTEFQKGAAGFGKAIYDVGRGLGQLTGIVDRKDVEEARKLDAPLMNTGSGLAGNIAGNVASFLFPGGFLKGAGAIASKLPKAQRIAQALSGAGSAIIAPKTIAGAAGAGAAMGAIQPSVSTEETIGNVALGGVGGAAVPTIARGLSTAKSAVEPFYQKGREQIIGRALRGVAGNQADDVARTLQSAQPLVQGSMPTAAEVAGSPGLAAMQRAATANNPVATNELALRQAANNEARLQALQGITPDKQLAEQAREQATKRLYETAATSDVVMTPELGKLMQRPSMKEAANRAKRLIGEKGGNASVISTGLERNVDELMNEIPIRMQGQDAQYIKMALDDMANAAPMTGIGGNELRSIQGTRQAYLDQLGQQIPEYLQANKAYAELSQPLNQADVLQEIVKKGSNQLTGDLMPSSFARALQDRTVQSVTGRPNTTLQGTLTPEQLSVLNNVKQDLANQVFAQNAGRGVGSNTVQNLAYSNMMNQAGIPTALTGFAPAGIAGNLLSRVGDVGYKSANEKIAAELADALLNPQYSGQLMQQVSPQAMPILNALRSTGTAIGVGSPYLFNSGKQ